MILFVGVTVLVLLMAYFCNTADRTAICRKAEGVQLHRNADGDRQGWRRGVMTRQHALNLWLCGGIYVILSALSVCRIASGNDYWVYTRMFSLIAQGRHVSSEFGFNTLVRGMQYFFGTGEYSYLPVFGLFSLLTVYFFLRTIYEQGNWFQGSMFLFLMSGYYFNSFNSVRYYLVLSIALYSTKYVLRGEYLKFILWILAAATFHKSVLVVIPIYLVARFLAGVKLKRWHFFVGSVFLCSLIFCQNIYRELIFFFYPYYRDSAFDNGRLSWMNIMKCVCVLLLCLICYRQSLENPKEHVADRFYFFLNLFGLVVYCCGSFIPEISRVGYYMISFQIFLLPNLLAKMKQGWLRRLCCAGVVVAYSVYFAFQLKGMYATDIRLLPYLNWIFN